MKQLPVGEDVALGLSREVAELGADLGLLVVIAERHSPIDRERVQRKALSEDGVLLVICESVLELISSVAVLSATPAVQIETELPDAFAIRMRELDVSTAGQREWRELVEARS